MVRWPVGLHHKGCACIFQKLGLGMVQKFTYESRKGSLNDFHIFNRIHCTPPPPHTPLITNNVKYLLSTSPQDAKISQVSVKIHGFLWIWISILRKFHSQIHNFFISNFGKYACSFTLARYLSTFLPPLSNIA